MSITKACAAVGVPRSTYASWVLDDLDGQAARSTRAIELGCDAIADECLNLADTQHIGEEITEKPSGVEVKRGDMISHRRLQIETRMRLLGQWSKKYSPKSHVDQHVSGGVVVLKSSPEDDKL